jgi:hypothetical protein
MNIHHRRRHLATFKICDEMGAAATPRYDYFVVCIDYGRKGREAVVDPDLTRAAVVDRIRSKEYSPIAFVHHVHGEHCEDITNEILSEAGFYDQVTA